MVSWWELTIPAASALAGSVVTAVIQNINLRSQRKYERKVHFLDTKRSAYARFLTFWDRVAELTMNAGKAKQTLTSLDKQLIEAEAKLSKAKRDGGNEGELAAARAEYTKVVGEFQRFKIEMDALSARLETATAESQEHYFELRILAPTAVRDAADKMLDIELVMNADRAVLDPLREAFEEEARKDLL